jgi:hypothetical protein
MIENIKKMVLSICSELKTLTPIEASYLAGLIDGEGSFFIQKNKRAFGFRYQPMMSITNTSTVIIELCNIYGGNYQAQEHTVNWKTVYRWFFNSKLMHHYLPQIAPYLKIKRKQAEVTLEALSYCKGTGYLNDNVKLADCRKRLMDLNARGKKKGRYD